MAQLSWGTKIAMLYIGFVSLIIFMVVLSMNQKIELVSSDYYARELKYQDKIDEMNNANDLQGTVEHTISANGVILNFPETFKGKKVNGEILFFRPSDASKDFKTEIKLDTEGNQVIPANALSKGMYKLQIGWSTDNKNYFIEKVIVIP